MAQDIPEENAAELQFPKEFENAETLMISEVNLLLQYRIKQNEKAEEEQEFSEVFTKTLNYTTRFSRFNNRDAVSTIRQMLAQKKLHKFELAQIANLAPEAPDEAKGLIPSLEGRFTDEELSQMLDDIQVQRSMQY
ncbi:DNA-directed RNA polymerase II subunit Rpb4 [Sarcoptes scabiei]|uniref:DNA-directed RNA polymerase II 16 kDa polypeptide n=1 Tax=Sarcoptes scabiei TaxID=52283 RepID=A0A131ZVY0_SARSC|nr:DNA-directed RNA polymerase II subunit Rpb4 [Sarcoptes scabiei]KPM02811.1 DNA-directed RNA polymerase II subunit RPB4-like protein [Sarcoptes scabiei]UXI16465.1 peroxisome biogenesis factor 6 [Sarcoptes scabiei]